MDWYYTEAGNRVGPISEDDFNSRIARGIITPVTLVWREGQADWLPLRQARPESDRERAREAVPSAPTGRHNCTNCGRSFPPDEVIRIHNKWVCASCKPVYFQRIKEGVDLVGQHAFAGFWVRFVAKFIDGLILGAVNLVTMIPIFVMTMNGVSAESLAGWNIVISLLQYPLGIAYTVWFLGRYAATPGKMALGLKVIRPQGEDLTYMRALGRYGGELISALTIGIGYIMAAFDGEKRTLHDRICDTRVIRTR